MSSDSFCFLFSRDSSVLHASRPKIFNHIKSITTLLELLHFDLPTSLYKASCTPEIYFSNIQTRYSSPFSNGLPYILQKHSCISHVLYWLFMHKFKHTFASQVIRHTVKVRLTLSEQFLKRMFVTHFLRRCTSYV